jgi:broad specificity phosphatase PhoE
MSSSASMMNSRGVEIVLVRHGESEGNRDGVFTGHGPSRLTALGRAQAEATARALADRRPAAIFTSDLPRALETAAPLARLSGVPVAETVALRERGVGEWTGLTFREVQERWPELWQALLSRDVDFRSPGGESHRDCRARVGAFLDGLFAAPPPAPDGDEGPTRVVLVSHGVALNHVLHHVLDVEADASRFFFLLQNCSLSRFERRPSGHYRIHTINDVAHLLDVGAAPG